MAGRRKGGRVIDLERERRLRELDTRFAELMEKHPELRDRTDRMLAGELPIGSPDLEGTMAENEIPTSLRLPESLITRADELIPAVERDHTLTAFGRVTRAAVLRLAIVRGLEVLEQQYSGSPKRRK